MAKQLRFKSLSNDAMYRRIAHTINDGYLFDDEAKEILRKYLHQTAEFSGVKLVSYARH
jgi:hypothetical protein